MQANLFFNSPYQIISWDVLPEWKGWYIMFGQEFLALNPVWNYFIVDFPFFRLDQSIPLDLPPQDAALADGFFQRIFEEYHAENKDKFQFIQAYTSLLLHVTKRYFSKLSFFDDTHNNRTADILLVSRFQALVEASVAGKGLAGEVRRPSFYARELHVHPNHLNAAAKRITGQTATTIIQSKFVALAKSFLKAGGLSVKEVAFRLHFKNTSHFNFLFKKATGLTPQQYQQL